MKNIKNQSEENYNEDTILKSKMKSISHGKNTFPISIKMQKTTEKTNNDTIDTSYSYRMNPNYNNKINEDLNYNPSTTNFSNSISTLDLLQKNESFLIKMRIGETQQKIAILQKNLDKKNFDISSLQEQLKNLKNEKNNKRFELENLLSNKESVEEIFKSLFQDDWSENTQRNNYDRLMIDINDLDNCPLNILIEQIKFIFDEFRVFYNDYDLKEISNEIQFNYPLIKKNNNLSNEDKVNKFLNEFFEPINKIVINKIPNNQLELLIKYCIKLISLDQRIQNNFNFINKIYKENKKGLKEKILELSNSRQILDEKLEEALNNISKLETKLNSYGKISRNQSEKNTISNQLRRGVLTKETKSDFSNYLYNNPNLNKENVYFNYNNYKKNSLNKGLKLPTTPKNYNNSANLISEGNVNDNSILKTQNSQYAYSQRSEIKNSSKHLINNQMNIQDCFCYFKFINKNMRKFNPLNNFDITPDHLGYIKGFISIDFSNKLLSFIPLQKEIHSYRYEKKEKNFTIQFGKINNIYIENIMKDILKIYINSLKYYKKCENDCHGNEENISLNKFIHLKEFNTIELDSSQKIKATQNKYFPFSLSLNDREDKFEIIFIDYNEFNNWYKGIDVIVRNNRKRNSKDKIGIIFQNLESYKRNNTNNNCFSYKYYTLLKK